jgi:hypothetical protein
VTSHRSALLKLAITLLGLALAAQVHAQWIERLPPVTPLPGPLGWGQQPAEPWALYELPTPARPASFFDPNIEATAPDALSLEPDPPAGPKPPPGAKPGMLQEVSLITTWLSGKEPVDLDVVDIDFKISLGLPCPTVETPMVLTPGLGMHFLEGPDSPDLPARVYDSFLDIRWILPLNEQFMFDLAVTPGWYSDWEQSGSEGLRIGARAIGIYTASPEARFVLGGAFLDREDVDFLPIAGLIWTPHDDLKLDLLFPLPKLSWRVSVDGSLEKWWYISGELGGGSWAIRRASGFDDVVNYTDLRVMLGQEIRSKGYLSAWFEVGYVFNRELDYNSGGPGFEPENTALVRGGVGY